MIKEAVLLYGAAASMLAGDFGVDLPQISYISYGQAAQVEKAVGPEYQGELGPALLLKRGDELVVTGRGFGLTWDEDTSFKAWSSDEDGGAVLSVNPKPKSEVPCSLS